MEEEIKRKVARIHRVMNQLRDAKFLSLEELIERSKDSTAQDKDSTGKQEQVTNNNISNNNNQHQHK